MAITDSTTTKEMPNNLSKWKKAGVVITALGLLAGSGYYIDTKADKSEVEKAETRMNKKIEEVKKDMALDIKEIKDSILRMESRIYGLLSGGKVVPR